MEIFIGFVILIILMIVILAFIQSRNPGFVAAVKASQAQVKASQAQMVCPHCQTKGSVTTRRVKLKKGISGGKAVGALLTAGVSVLATGLSRKEDVTEAKCSNCGSVWHF